MSEIVASVALTVGVLRPSDGDGAATFFRPPRLRLALRRAREEVGVSQDRLAELASRDRTYVSGIERGERNPSLAILLKLANALGVRFSDIVARRGAHQRHGAVDLLASRETLQASGVVSCGASPASPSPGASA